MTKDDEVIGYEFVSLGKDDWTSSRRAWSANEAYQKAMGKYGRFDGAAKYIDPRKQ